MKSYLQYWCVGIFMMLCVTLSGELSQKLIGADSLYVGDSFRFEIQTDYPIKKIEIPDTLKSFKILDTEIQKKGNGGSATITIAVFDLGALSFPKVEVKSASLLHDTEFTDAFRVYVLSTRAEADTLLRDIKAPQKFPYQPPFWLYLLIFIAIIVLGITWLILRFRKDSPKAPPPVKISQEKAIAPIPAWKIALDKLDALQNGESTLLEYHYQLSGILREYLEAKYRFNAMEMTTFEIRDQLQTSRLEDRDSILTILAFCDMVKFAKDTPTDERVKLNTQDLRLYLLKQKESTHV